MNTNLRPDLWLQARQTLNRWSGRPAVELLIRCLGYLGAGFLLAGASAAGSWLPLPICLAAALGLGLPSFSAYVGGCLGYLVFWNATAALEPMAAGLLVEAGLCIFGDQVMADDRWYVSCSTMVFCALAGFLFLLEQRFAPVQIWRWLLRIAAAGAAAMCFRLALRQADQTCRLILLACLCAGLCAVAPVGMPLGTVAAAALAASAVGTSLALPAAVIVGLALDISWKGGCAAAVFSLGALVCRNMPKLLRLPGWVVCVLAGVLLTGSDSLLLAAAFLGAPLSLLLPAGRLFDALPAVQNGEDRRLAAAAGLLDQLQQCLDAGKTSRDLPETAAVFDHAAERVCRMCSQWELCWEKNAAETVESLNRAAPAMLDRGMLLREDLPPLFLSRCRHLESFITAVNRELDDLCCRRQCRSRIQESRRILSGQYGVLAQALSRHADVENGTYRYCAEVGFRSRGRKGDAVSGDRGASFRIGQLFYLLLCDGMGTGAGAAAEAGAAIGILRTLLQAGTMPEEALQVLNGIYILRDDGGFSTVDLLQADLNSGEVSLYKWGAAPSYLKKKGTVEKIGTVSLPPGLGAGETHQPEETRLSLARGEMLVLVSDGAGGEAAERFLRQYGGTSPKEVASGIISCSCTQEEDDRTAAVVMLRPRFS